MPAEATCKQRDAVANESAEALQRRARISAVCQLQLVVRPRELVIRFGPRTDHPQTTAITVARREWLARSSPRQSLISALYHRHGAHFGGLHELTQPVPSALQTVRQAQTPSEPSAADSVPWNLIGPVRKAAFCLAACWRMTPAACCRSSRLALQLPLTVMSTSKTSIARKLEPKRWIRFMDSPCCTTPTRYQ